MPLTSTITNYDEHWPLQFEAEEKNIRPIFDVALKAIHHVGSTAVEGSVAKPEIDILIVVDDTSALDEWQTNLTKLGYRRGRDLSAGHHFFKRDIGEVRTHKLHVCKTGHPKVDIMLRIRDHLRANSEDRIAYGKLKIRLERENKTGIAEYLSAKAPFLDGLWLKCK